jgi:Protein of unknown function (DUF2934)
MMWRKRNGKDRTKAANASAVTSALSPDDRGELVRQTAYFLSERRGFDPRRDIENWLEAERQVDAGLVGPGSQVRTHPERPPRRLFLLHR